MGTTFRFMAIGDEVEVVLDWFRGLPDPPEFVRAAGDGYHLFFHSYGNLAYKQTDAGTSSEIDASKSPLVSLFPPIHKRGVLWTVGEVHFLPTPIRQVCPALYSVSGRFRKWLAGFNLVFRQEPGWKGQWDYYLDGSIRNHDSDVLALPRAVEALNRGQYFVDHDDSDAFLDRICATLRLRGVEGIRAE